MYWGREGFSELEFGSHSFSRESWYLGDSTALWLVILDFESLSLDGVLLHFVVVVSANCVKIVSLLQLLKHLNAVVHLEHLLNAVVVVAHVVAVLENSKCSVDLILKHYYLLRLL